MSIVHERSNFIFLFTSFIFRLAEQLTTDLSIDQFYISLKMYITSAPMRADDYESMHVFTHRGRLDVRICAPMNGIFCLIEFDLEKIAVPSIECYKIWNFVIIKITSEYDCTC